MMATARRSAPLHVNRYDMGNSRSPGLHSKGFESQVLLQSCFTGPVACNAPGPLIRLGDLKHRLLRQVCHFENGEIHHFLNGESSKVTLVRLSQDYALGMPCHGCIGCPWYSQVFPHGAMKPYCQVQRACGEMQHQGAASNSSIVWKDRS